MTNWIIANTQFNTSDQYITTAHWIASLTDGDYRASTYGSCGFPAGEPTIPYKDVTEAEVLAWIWANGVDKDGIEAQLVANIELQKNPVSASGTPWQTNTPVGPATAEQPVAV